MDGTVHEGTAIETQDCFLPKGRERKTLASVDGPRSAIASKATLRRLRIRSCVRAQGGPPPGPSKDAIYSVIRLARRIPLRLEDCRG